LSFAEPTSRPVETMFCSRASDWLVEFRFSSATRAPAFVLTLSMGTGPLHQGSGVILTAGGVLPDEKESKAQAARGQCDAYA